LQADVDSRRYNSDFPAGGATARDLNRDGRISPATSELATFLPLNNAGNPNLGIAASMPWRFDTSNGGFTAFGVAESNWVPSGGGSTYTPPAWFYSTGGGCGWQTQNNGVSGGGPTPP